MPLFQALAWSRPEGAPQSLADTTELLPRGGAGDRRAHEPPLPHLRGRRPRPGPLRAPLQPVAGPAPAAGREAPARGGGERQRGAAPVHGPHRGGAAAGPDGEAAPRGGDRGGPDPRGGSEPAAARGPVRGGPVGARRPAAHPRAPLDPGERARGRRAHHPRLRRRASASSRAATPTTTPTGRPLRLSPRRGRRAAAQGRRDAPSLARGHGRPLHLGLLRHRLPGGPEGPAPHQPPRGRALVERRHRGTAREGRLQASLRDLPRLLPQGARALRPAHRTGGRRRGPRPRAARPGQAEDPRPRPRHHGQGGGGRAAGGGAGLSRPASRPSWPRPRRRSCARS